MSNFIAEQEGEIRALSRGKFTDPDVTANGQPRASVALDTLETLWFNTGTLCNIECVNCYIGSSPTNDRLAYISSKEVSALLDEIKSLSLSTREIGFTGGEPFMNPDMLAMTRDALERGHEVLILTNAMQPMLRKRIKSGLLDLLALYGNKLTLRISLDHFTQALHETERGANSWKVALEGLDWLSENGFQLAIAGRTCWNEKEEQARKGYAQLIKDHNWRIDASDPAALLLLPEMDETAEVPEISHACWSLLNINPSDMMCATSRMVVKRKGEATPTVLPCTLLPYSPAYGMGTTLKEAAQTDGGMFDSGAVKLCHPHCAKFCVLGGGSCSG
jgi:sulfatase maturation enzyme AslB (radical SAM superfamily)